MEIIDPRINTYIEKHTSEPEWVLQKIERDTHLKSIYPRMLSGKIQGRFIAMISRMIRPKYILEIGTFTGYSAICLCEGLNKDGQLHTIEINEELKDQNKKNFIAAGVDHLITAHFGDASEIIPNLGISFDLVFIDADKINYSKYYSQIMDILKKGGFILADNVLWSGKVLEDPNIKIDKDTKGVIEFNEMVQADSRVQNVMIPLRDGMTLIEKIC